jgi:uncharacterized protein YjiS (DUF1127 family)
MSCTQSIAAAKPACRHGFPPAGSETRLRQAAFAYLWHTLILWCARGRQRRDLAELDAHLLKDIGVTPGQAAREAAKPFWVA